MEKRSCVVIGAGLSGLAAAYELTQKKWDVTVLEADPKRIGGRVFTFNFKQASNLYCELGGEWVGNGHRQMKKLCRQFGLEPLLRHSFDYTFLHQLDWKWDNLSKRNGFYCDEEMQYVNMASSLMSLDKAFIRKADGTPFIASDLAYQGNDGVAHHHWAKGREAAQPAQWRSGANGFSASL